MTMPAWNPIQWPVSKFILSDYPSAGICRGPTGAAVVRNLDERVGPGIDGAFVVFTGRRLARFSTELLLRTREDWTYWQETFRPLIHAVPQRGPVDQVTGVYKPGTAHTIWHPQLYPLDITQCIVEEEPQEEIDDYMIGHVLIKFIQVKKAPRAAYAKPEAAQTAKPLTADQQTIKALSDQYASKRQLNEAAGQ